MKTFILLAKSFRNCNEVEFDWFDLSFSDRRRMLNAILELHGLCKPRTDKESEKR